MVAENRARACHMLIFTQRLSCPHWPNLSIFLLQPPESLRGRSVSTDAVDGCPQANCGSEWGLLVFSEQLQPVLKEGFCGHGGVCLELQQLGSEAGEQQLWSQPGPQWNLVCRQNQNSIQEILRNWRQKWSSVYNKDESWRRRMSAECLQNFIFKF